MFVYAADDAAAYEAFMGRESGQGRTGRYVTGLAPAARAELRRHVEAAYGAGMPDGPRSFAVVVRAVRGTVPG
ncbi:MAG: hypothetical protein ACK4QW_10985 [Alphaproteobacteria bacterium]